MSKYLQGAGSFECVVVAPQSGWFGETKDKQTPFIRIQLRVSEGTETGAEIEWRGWLTEDAQDKTIQRIIDVFEWDGELQSLRDGCLISRPCNIQTEIETYNGKDRCKVKWLNRPGGGAKPMEESKVSQLIARVKERAKSKVRAEAPNKPVATDDSDDIPF